MTREQVHCSSQKPYSLPGFEQGPLVLKSGRQTSRPAGRQLKSNFVLYN
jgi:hypothetical protein